MTIVVFLGPTLRLDVARQLLPEAIFLPPAKQADIVSALGTYEPEAIGLIDGAFAQSLSVWHKELLFALHQGVRVLGAASMGALRAAELQPFGMIGVGEIYRRFRDGELQDDDEVAIAHAGAELDFQSLSEAMVNVRDTVQRAHAEGALPELHARAIVDAAKRMHFSERVLPRIIAAADLPAEVADRALAALHAHYVDVKAADARQLLQALRQPASSSAPPPAVRSRGFRRLINEERRVRTREAEVPLRDIAVHAALHLTDFDELNFNALNRALVQVLAHFLEIQPTSDEVEAEATRFLRQRGLQDAGARIAWRRANHLSRAEFDALIHELAVCRRLQRWLLTSQHADDRTRWLLDELRLAGRYTNVANAAAQQTGNRDPVGLGDLSREELLDLIAAHQRTTGWQPAASLSDWSEEAGFADLKDLAYALLRLNRRPG